jgi:uncharacterized membrane protein
VSTVPAYTALAYAIIEKTKVTELTEQTKNQSEEGIWRLMNPVAFLIACFVLVGALRDIYVLVDAFDTGLYLQWLNGYWQNGTLSSSVTGEDNFLAHHFQPIALLFSPLATFFARPVTLYLLSAAAIGLSWWIGRKYFLKNHRWYNGVFLLLVAHPAISGRLWFSFVPDILAFPAFFWMALQLSNPVTLRLDGRNCILWICAFLWAGLAKETFWLTNAVVAVVAFIRLQNSSRAKLFFAVLAMIHVSMFLVLFLSWMPANTNMASYYGLTFYFGPNASTDLSPVSLVIQLAHNFFSLTTLKTLLHLIFLTCAVFFLRPSVVWLAALPGLGLILLSSSSQLHHPANHYLIPVLPFLFVPAFFAQERYGRIMARIPRGIGPAYWSLIPIGFAVFMSYGIVDQVINIVTNKKIAYLRDDVQIAKIQHLGTSDHLVVDGLLQPLFPEYENVTVLLGHIGNPKRLDLKQLSVPLKIVTTVDLKAIADCSTVRVGAEHLKVDYQYFQELCLLVQSRAIALAAYKDSGLYLFSVPGQTRE